MLLNASRNAASASWIPGQEMEMPVNPQLYREAAVACAAANRGEMVFEVLKVMQDDGVKPDRATYRAAIEACENSGLGMQSGLTQAWGLLDDLRSRGFNQNAVGSY